MPMIHFAFLRNVMIGRNGLTQGVLLDIFRQCGALNPVSFLATGNVGFELDDGSTAEFANRVTSRLNSTLGLEEPLYIRSLSALAKVQCDEPFSPAPKDNIHECCVTFLPAVSVQLPQPPIVSTRRDVEIFRVTDTEIFSVTRLIDGRTGSAGKTIERIAAIKVTTRNWRTIEKMLRQYA